MHSTHCTRLFLFWQEEKYLSFVVSWVVKGGAQVYATQRVVSFLQYLHRHYEEEVRRRGNLVQVGDRRNYNVLSFVHILTRLPRRFISLHDSQ